MTVYESYGGLVSDAKTSLETASIPMKERRLDSSSLESNNIRRTLKLDLSKISVKDFTTSRVPQKNKAGIISTKSLHLRDSQSIKLL